MISEITKDLRNGLSLDETLTKHNTNLKELFKINNPSKFSRKGKAKYYYWDKSNKAFRIEKKRVYYGFYKTEDAARLAVALFDKYGWSKENNWRIKSEVKEILGDRYYE